ncbi:MAG TPA: ABC transporter permease [Geminicoccaceae bacterium]|nr:ABC transporter permease [Geminicoccus sp.]HMU48178.1 ABC transporter permease [Geminicoccaceae bacterium]
MHATVTVLKRELKAYFATPLAYVFIVIFLALAGAFTFFLGSFFERGQADLESFFVFHPWLYLFLVPAVAMRLWAEERRSGTIELLMTLPVTPFQAVLGKFLAAWLFAGIALLLTFPIWLTVNYLGSPDNGAILVGYLGSWLMAGAFIAIGACVSALTKNQVIAFVLGAAVCFLFLMSGMDLVLVAFRAWAPPTLVDVVASFSFITQFGQMMKGVLDLASILFFASLIVVCLVINALLVDLEKAA